MATDPYKELHEAVRDLSDALIARGLFTRGDLEREVERINNEKVKQEYACFDTT